MVMRALRVVARRALLMFLRRSHGCKFAFQAGSDTQQPAVTSGLSEAGAAAVGEQNAAIIEVQFPPLNCTAIALCVPRNPMYTKRGRHWTLSPVASLSAVPSCRLTGLPTQPLMRLLMRRTAMLRRRQIAAAAPPTSPRPQTPTTLRMRQAMKTRETTGMRRMSWRTISDGSWWTAPTTTHRLRQVGLNLEEV